MKKIVLSLCGAAAAIAAHAAPAPSPNGITRPDGYQDWKPIAVSQRTDSSSLRIILGNEVAHKAIREGKTNPWPDGTILSKPSWKQKVHERFPAANVPGELMHVDFMIKDSAKYPTTGGWGFARWLGDAAQPYGQNADFVQECFACHSAAKDTDWTFTRPVKLP